MSTDRHTVEGFFRCRHGRAGLRCLRLSGGRAGRDAGFTAQLRARDIFMSPSKELRSYLIDFVSEIYLLESHSMFFSGKLPSASWQGTVHWARRVFTSQKSSELQNYD